MGIRRCLMFGCGYVYGKKEGGKGRILGERVSEDIGGYM